MTKQLLFISISLVALGAFSYTLLRLRSFFKVTKTGPKTEQLGDRLGQTLKVALGQTKILRNPVVGFIHALVFWGFLVITIGTLEMILDGFLGTERILSSFGILYSIITASGDLLAVVVLVSCAIFLFRRYVLNVARFAGSEMTSGSTIDATIALILIMMLMISLLGLNTGYLMVNPQDYVGVYPVSQKLAAWFQPMGLDPHLLEQSNWWLHVILVFLFANILPYSKHFHVFMSIPNVFLSRLDSPTKIRNMESVTHEVKLMMNPETAFAAPDQTQEAPARFGVKDVEDVSWKTYLDSLTCTECGRCTSVCPANLTGKKLSPRKLFIDLRRRMNQKGPGLAKDPNYSDDKSLLGDYITAEELWACTTCNACAQECPVNIDHPSLIVDMRRYMVMEESSAPSQLNVMFSNIENNGAPWPFAQTERMKWADNIVLNQS